MREIILQGEVAYRAGISQFIYTPSDRARNRKVEIMIWNRTTNDTLLVTAQLINLNVIMPT